MRVSYVLRKEKGAVAKLGEKLGQLTGGNWVNPRATDPMQPGKHPFLWRRVQFSLSLR
jgi:hypothetical protein